MRVTTTDQLRPWVLCARPNPGATLRLLCFPYAGGGGSVFRTWPDALPANVEVLAVELPGRETRFSERPMESLAALVASFCDATASLLDAPFAIYGHSMGALIGFSVARELQRRAKTGPVHLFVSGRRAPYLGDPSPLHGLSTPQLLERLRRMGGIPDLVFQEPELMARFLPILRADFALNDVKATQPGLPLSCPITVMGGAADAGATTADLEAWRPLTTASFQHETFPGGHFFIQTARAAVLASLGRGLSQIPAVR